jgi:DNA-binding NtrC family response regulator
MAEPGYEEILAAFRAAARLSNERFLVGVAAATERSRVVAALAAEGEVIALTSAEIALERLAEESFELVVLDQGSVEQNILTAAREIRPFADVVPIIDGDPALAAEMFSREAAAVLPRPLPASDALFRAHLRYLASCRRARTRALMLSHVIAQNRAALRTIEPALEGALVAVLEASQAPPVVAMLGDGELAGSWAARRRRAKPTSSWWALAPPIGSSFACAKPATGPLARRW